MDLKEIIKVQREFHLKINKGTNLLKTNLTYKIKLASQELV